MTTQTFEITDEELTTINMVKAVTGIKSIKEAVKFIINDYSKNKDYSKFLKEKRKQLKKGK